MIIPLDLFLALGPSELIDFFWFAVLMDVPRYLIAAIILAVIPHGQTGSMDEAARVGSRPNALSASHRGHSLVSANAVCGIVACHNEEATIKACVASMRANGVEQIIVVNDGSTDRTHEIAAELDTILVDLSERVGKPNAINVGLPLCNADLVLVADADTTFPDGALAKIIPYFESRIGGVGFRLSIANEALSLTTRYQAIEYEIVFTASRRIADALSILPNISGAAGIFRREALLQVGGWDCEVAEDVALAIKLRLAGWQLRYAPDAIARTVAPATMVDLLLQRLRWDASIITIWWFKHRAVINPFSSRFTVSNLFTALDVLIFSAVMPLILPFYLFWLWSKIESSALILLGAVMVGLALIELVILLLVRVPLRLVPYVPFYIIVQTIIMRPLRVIALIAELVFSITRYDPYLPKSQRDKLT